MTHPNSPSQREQQSRSHSPSHLLPTSQLDYPSRESSASPEVLHDVISPSEAGSMSSEEEPSPVPLPNDSASSKRKFGTVDTARPTPVKKRVTQFVDGPSFNSRGETTKQTLGRVAKAQMNKYDYDDCLILDGQIRLLLLKPDPKPDADIVVELRAHSIEDLARRPEDQKFAALSYNWGHDDETKVVLVDMTPDKEPAPRPTSNGFADVVRQLQKRMRRLNVKPNLYAFLQQVRDHHKEIALWVDRICINQQNNMEKQHQVSMMSAIYSTAASVSIWLGPADEDTRSDRAMDFIYNVLQEDIEKTFITSTAERWTDLLHLMRRRWFSRRWIIQELALARNAEVRCGSKTVHWRDFSDAVSLFELHFTDIMQAIRLRPDLEKSLGGVKDLKPLGARILVEVLANTFQRHANERIYAPRQGLESLVSSLPTFETSDPRDTVYTLLNLAKETFELPKQSKLMVEQRQKRREKNPPPEPDYTINLLQVYTNFVKWCVQESNSLDILFRHWALPELKHALDDHYPGLVKLPSWIKTVGDSAYGKQSEGFGGRKTGDSFVGTPETRCYNASLGMLPEIYFGADEASLQNAETVDDEPVQKLKERVQIVITQANGSRPRKARRAKRLPLDLSSSIVVRGRCLGKVEDSSLMLEGIIPKQVLTSLGHNSESTELDQVSDVLWRTLVADRGTDGKPPPPWYHRACLTCIMSDTTYGNIDTNRILQEAETSKLVAGYIKRVQAVCWNRTFIKCEDDVDRKKKLVGIGPGESRIGDLVCILYGCSVPCLLRPVWRGNDTPEYHELVGEAFIMDKMDGQAISDLSEEDREGESFRLM